MSKLQKLTAIDLGNGVTDYKAANGKEGSFPSIVVDYSKLDAAAQQFVKPFKLSKGNYIVGNEAKSLTAESRSTDSSYYSSDAYRVCFLYALSKIGIKDPYLVLGLPTEFFESNRNTLRDNIKKWCKEDGYTPEGIMVLPQHMGPYFDPNLMDIDGNKVTIGQLKEGLVGIVDIGHGTLDLGEFNSGSAGLKHFGESKGISDIHKEVLTILSNPSSLSDQSKKIRSILPKDFEIDSRTNEKTIDTWFRQGYIPYKGSKIDIFDLSLPARNDFSKKYVLRGITEMWGNTKFLSGIILAGGGVEVIGLETLGRHIECTIYKSAEPNMSVVRGFYQAASIRVQSQEKTG
jgi:hypothetical protein